MTNKVLIIDDESQIRKILRITLEANDYQVIEASTANEGIVLCASQQPGLILLDLGLPDMDGLEVLKEIRTWSEIPVIILSVRNADEDIVHALDLGADDYICKPFNVKVLLARIRVSLRKLQQSEEAIISHGELTVDVTSHTVKVSGELVKLTNTEYQLLCLFLKNCGKVLTHGYILEKIWGQHYNQQVQYLRVFVAQLRKKIEDTNPAKRLIETESGVGYRMNTIEK